jgi:ubiquinone/menaquinone biosynthesis C-methylase UbiE
LTSIRGKVIKPGMKYRAIVQYYDAENAGKPMLREDVPFLLRHFARGQRVLELAVGTGRAAIPMAQAGHRVVGIDNDPAMLAIARRKRDFVGLSEKELELVRGDMLTLDLGRKFDWVVLLFNTFLVFTTQKEQERALLMMRRHLKAGGRVWIDVFQPNLAILAHDGGTGLDPTFFSVPELGRTVYRTTDVRPDGTGQAQRVKFVYRWFEEGGREKRKTTAFDLAVLFPRELRLLVERVGMRVERMYGDYGGGELAGESERMIVVCRAK